MGLAVIHSMRGALGGDRGKLTLRISASIRGDSIHVYDLKQTRSQKKGFFADFSPWSPNDLSPSMDWGSTLYMIYVLTLQVWGFFLFCFLYFKVIPVNLECTKRCRNTWAKNLNAYSVSTFTSSSADWLSLPTPLHHHLTSAQMACLVKTLCCPGWYSSVDWAQAFKPKGH